MVKKTRLEILKDSQERIRKCEQWRESENLDRTWRRLNDLYRGKHWPSTTVNNQDLIAVNLAFSTINVIAPSVAVNYPKVVVQANNVEDRDKAIFVEAIFGDITTLERLLGVQLKIFLFTVTVGLKLVGNLLSKNKALAKTNVKIY